MAEPIVLLPGMMCDARIYGPQIADLSRDFAVMCAPIDQGERIEEIASRLLDQVPGRFALVGHSMGGIVAMELLRRAPDRVSRLCLMSTTPLPETPQQAAERDPRLIRAKSGRFDEVLREEFPSALVGHSMYRNEIMALFMDMAQGMGVEAYVRQSRALQRRKDQQGTLRRISFPTLVLCGDRDPLTPVKRHSFMSELIPPAQLQVLEGVGHLPTLEAPEAVAHALRNWMAQPLVLR
jgi:pimeloyl-ACP methyl ester carboxylesterase